ncbi:MAG TPA: thioredoxin domain-containing protein [Bryocella sp.]|nr:thioredoxin domain-containing protein [Bryocella sp.]
MENGLARSASAYLRSARHQPVEWHEWGAEAFEKARRENKPVLLDIGAVWCHWCHVMDRESYENDETAQVLNEHYVAVKVDRDERPDVDTRYQSAVATISGQGGWPLTAFLTPDGKPFFGGTYFPPDERYGRPGFRRVLLTMAHAFQERREEVEESAGSILTMIEHNESFSGRSGEPGTALLEKIIDPIVRMFDARNGGFGSQPKFPHAGAIDLLIDVATRGVEHAEAARNVAIVTLKKMAAGGIHDQLAGGFHRYSVDEQWIVPHFEKMAYDNSELLKNYAHAFQSFADPEFAQVANGILRWMDEWLSDRERGGFYASQDADDSLDDDGDYFTWTRDEAQAVFPPQRASSPGAPVLSVEEFRVAEAYFNLRPVGDMHHNPAKNVLHTPRAIGDVAKALGVEEAKARELLKGAKEKMYAARLKRRTPYVDRTVYTNWNGMCISAYIAAGRALGLKEPVEFALKSLDRVLREAWSEERGLVHVVAYGEGAAPERAVPGVLEDYAFLANAALDAWEASGEMRYFDAAQKIADAMLGKFYDATGCGFFDTEVNSTEERIGALVTRRKPLQDAPTPAGNSVAATVLLRLAALTNDKNYETRAQETLETFAGVVEHFGLYAASYALALRRMIEPPVQACIVGEDSAAKELQVAAMARYMVNKSVIQLRRDQMQALPPALKETLPNVPPPQRTSSLGTPPVGDGSFALVCKGNSCLPPIKDAEELYTALA